MRHDLLSDVLSSIKNGDKVGKRKIIVPSSKMTKEVLILMQKHEYIGNFEYIDDGKGGKFKISLLGNVNKCGSIRPRYSVAADGYGKYKRRFLPASGFGMLIVTTSKGIMIHREAEKSNLGGKLLAFVY
ncbi:MAG: 30S ribosomal protein S8 [Candidatus Aenigmarchaeota archaeon]|nr:30S ribosomal protein S8 [Candidatus Aenigmarchaeota archaeon]